MRLVALGNERTAVTMLSELPAQQQNETGSVQANAGWEEQKRAGVRVYARGGRGIQVCASLLNRC